MNKFLLTTVLIIVIIGVMLYFVPQDQYADVLNYIDRNAVVNVYCRKTSCPAVDMGLGYQTSCSVEDFKSTLAKCDGVDGVSVSFAGTVDDIEKIAERLRAETVNTQELNGLLVVCFTANGLQGGVTLCGKRVNLQIAYCNGTITVGYPLILGSY